MFGNSFTNLFFRFVNFATLMALSYWLFRKYVRNKIEEKINQKEALIKGLEEQGHFLEGKVQDLKNQLLEREKKIINLKQKIDEWVFRIQAERYRKEEEHRRNIADAIDRVNIKNKNIAQEKLHIQILPNITHQAEQILIKKFSNPDSAKMYLNTIIKSLEGK